MKLLKSIGWTTIATITTVIGSLSFYKIFSFFLGPPGIALLAHLQNMLAIATTLPNDGINRGTIKYLSGKGKDNKLYTTYMASSLVIQLLIFLGTLPLLYLLFQQIQELPSFIKSDLFIGLFFIGAFFQVVMLYLFSFLLAAEKFRAYAIFSIANSICSIIILYFAMLYGEQWACLALLFSPLVIVSVLTMFFLRSSQRTLFGKILPNRSSMRDLSQFLLLAGCTLVFGRMVEYFVRLYILAHFDVYQTGLWQSAVKLSDGYTSLFNGILGVVFFPRISAIMNKDDDLRSFYLKITGSVIPFVLAGLAIVYIFQATILRLVFNPSFIPAGPFLNCQLLGDAFKFASFLMVYLIVARAAIKTYVILELISAANYLVLLFIFSRYEGIIAVSHAFVGRYMLYFTMLIFLTLRYFSRYTKERAQP